MSTSGRPSPSWSLIAATSTPVELLALGAPSELVRASVQAAADEVRHAELCLGLASRYAGAPVGPGRLDTTEPGGQAPVEVTTVALAVLEEGGLGETTAALLAARAAELATDPAARAALLEIAGDEARHAELAWRFVAWAVSVAGARLQEAIGQALRRARPALVADHAPNGDASRLAQHGWLSGAERNAVARQALRQVVGPCGQALLSTAAVGAWSGHRSLTA